MKYSPRLILGVVLSVLTLSTKAELINVTVIASGSDIHNSGSMMSGSGTGTYDTETFELLLYMDDVSTHSTDPYIVTSENTVNIIDDWGQFRLDSCTDSGTQLNCGSVPLNTWLSMSILDNTVDSTGNGSVSAVWGGYYTAQYEITSVPVPAAAWLFGSALLGLLGSRLRTERF